MAQSKRQMKINALTAFEPRPDRVALRRIHKHDLEPVYDTSGTVTDTKRRTNVFRVLRNSGSITPNESAAGAKLVEIYAKWKGMAGSPDDADMGWASISGSSSPDLVTDKMIESGREWSNIMNYVGPSSARLLLALCHDIVEGDGTFIVGGHKGQPKVRWRHIVETVTGETDRDKQTVHVSRACADLWEYWR